MDLCAPNRNKSLPQLHDRALAAASLTAIMELRRRFVWFQPDNAMIGGGGAMQATPRMRFVGNVYGEQRVP
jgi:hypothetical protein